MDQDVTPAIRQLARARRLLDHGEAEEAAGLLREAARAALQGGADHDVLVRIFRLRVLCVRDLAAVLPPGAVWTMLEDLAPEGGIAADASLVPIGMRCVGRALVALEGEPPLPPARWAEIALWRRRMAMLAPDRRHNWSGLVLALIRAGQGREAQAVLDHPDPEIAAWLDEAIGSNVEVVRMLLRPDGSVAPPVATDAARHGATAIRRELAAARLLLDEHRPEEAASLLAAADVDARLLDEDAYLEPITRLRVMCAAKMPAETPAETVWGMLAAIDTVDIPAADAELAHARARCAMREADRLEAGWSLVGTEWDLIALWRERIAALGPERRHNWNRLVTALIYGDRAGEARRIMAHADPEIAAFLRDTIGVAADIVPALRKGTEGVYRREAPRYLQRGLPVIPCLGDIAIYPGWENFSEHMPAPSELVGWANLPHAQIGLVLGPCSGIGALEIMSNNPVVIDAITRALPPTPWRRVNREGVMLAFRRGEAESFRGELSGAVIYAYGDDRSILMLPPSIQAKDGAPFASRCHLADVLDDLPALPADAGALLQAAIAGFRI